MFVTFVCNDINTYQFILQAKTTTFVMCWHFKLIWAVTLMMQCRCNTQLVSLHCSEDGAAPVINCTIWTDEKCVGYQYMWMDSNNKSICNSGNSNYKCEWDNQTFVSLVFTKGAECDTYKVFIEASCGLANSIVSVTHCGAGELLFLCICL